MGKIQLQDKLRIQTLREMGYGYRRIAAKYPDRGWKLGTVKSICKRVDERGSATERKIGSGRPKSARTEKNCARVAELICSQENAPGTSKSTRVIAKDLGISDMSVRRIAKKDLKLSSFRRVPAQVITDDTKTKRLERSKYLLRRFTQAATKRVFFTDEKLFYANPPLNKQNNRVWSRGKKSQVAPSRLLAQRAKFGPRVMVSAGVCYEGKGRLHFIDEKAKVNSCYYVSEILPKLIEDCNNLLGDNFTFQQDGAPAHGAKITQDWLRQNCPDFIDKDSWPPNSPDMNPLDYHVWGAMSEVFDKLNPKPRDVAELKVALEGIWNNLPDEPIRKSVLSFRRRLSACVKAGGSHFEQLGLPK